MLPGEDDRDGEPLAVAEESQDAEGTEEEAGAPGGDDPGLLRAVAALVFASPEPLTDRRIASLLETEGRAPSLARIRRALEGIGERLAASGLPLELRSIGGGWRILTSADTGEVVQRLFEQRRSDRISPAALETLAIVAYRQPVTKAEIEAIRGVQAGPILRALVDRGLVRISGRADVPGHPLQYATTQRFLDRFGLSGLEDLPRDSELAQ